MRAKSLALTGLIERLVAPLDVRLISPPDPEARGCQLSLRLGGSPRRGRHVFERLGKRGVVCDWREPDVLRVAPVPLYNRFEDVHRFADELALALREIP